MSGLDQPLLIATVGYHVGHQRSIRVAEELGYFKEEGLTDYVYDYRGLIPGPLEAEGLWLAMQEHGVDIAAGATVEAVITHRARGVDFFVVGGWRYLTKPKIVSAKHITRVEDLRGKKIGLRELGTLTDRLISFKLLQVGINPRTEVEWVQHPAFAYSMTSEHADMLRSGQVDAIQTSGKYLDELLGEGYPLLIDGDAPERRGRPGRVIVATRQVVEQRGDELAAFLKANLRAHWVWSDPDQFEYVYRAETRMRESYTHNEDERRVRVVKRAPDPADSLMPLDGRADADGMRGAIEEMVLLGEISEPLDPEDFVRSEFMERAFSDLCQRPSLQDAVAKILPHVTPV